MSHDPYSPWPQHDATFRFERFVAYRIIASFAGKWPIYARHKEFSAKWGSWPFFAFDFGFLRGYIGYKPINLMDKHFAVSEWFRPQPAVELSARLERKR
jgi:hypothetical protein